ncbi:MAG: hypothetical protein OCD02_19800 [Spirochaetaceae bacterium]
MKKNIKLVEPIPAASLNRLYIPKLEKNGLELLSSKAVKIIKEQEPQGWTNIFSERLAILLETLWHGTGWQDKKYSSEILDIREFWSNTVEIMVGGGILTGDDGITIVNKTNVLLKNITNKKLTIAPSSHNMVIDGLLSKNSANTLAIDFGHTSVKSAFIDGSLKRTILKPVVMNLDGQNEKCDEAYLESLLLKVKTALKEILNGLNGNKVTLLNISIAAYLENNQFAQNKKGGYCQLRLLNTNALSLFTNLWNEIYDDKTQIQIYHDGNAAAKILETSPGAIIVFGTSIGYGFKN